MKVHNWHALGWLVWGLGSVLFFAVWEYIALTDKEDSTKPLTYYIRKAVGDINNPLWWLLLGALVWMIVHFLFIHEH